LLFNCHWYCDIVFEIIQILSIKKEQKIEFSERIKNFVDMLLKRIAL